MNRNKKHTDWTDALRDRLQDASLPLEGDTFPALSGISDPAGTGALRRQSRKERAGRERSRAAVPPVWGWALAGAAAVLAAVLLLRPAAPDGQPGVAPAGPEPVHLVEAPASGTPGTAAPSDQLVAQALERRKTPSSEKAVFEEKAGKKDLSSSERAGNEEGIPDQVGNDESATRNDDNNARSDETTAQNSETVAWEDKTVVLSDDQGVKAEDEAGKPQSQSLEELKRGDFAAAGEPETTGARGPRRPVSLRLQAAGPGVALAAGGKAAFGNVPYSDQGYYNGASKAGQLDNQEPQSPARTQAPFPISVGVAAALPLSRSWTLAAGLDYTQRAAARIATLHYLGLPLDLHYYFNPESRLRVWLGGGLKAEKSIYVTGAEPLRDPVLFSGNLQAGADLRVLPGVRLYVSPALTRYLNHSAYAVSWDEGSSFSLRAGLSFDLK